MNNINDFDNQIRLVCENIVASTFLNADELFIKIRTLFRKIYDDFHDDTFNKIDAEINRIQRRLIFEIKNSNKMKFRNWN